MKEQKIHIENISSYTFLVLISMVYMSIMLCNAVLTNRYIGADVLFVLGGTFTSPFIFILNDIIAEIYGYKISQRVIFMGFIGQALFVLICQIVMSAPYPAAFTEHMAFNSIWRMVSFQKNMNI